MMRQQLLLTAVLFAVSPFSYGQTVWDGSEADDFWFTADNWDTGIAPTGATAQAVVGTPSPTVTNGAVLLQSLSVTADGVLNVGVSQNFNFAPGAATSLTNAGSITALNNSDLQVLGMVDNTGSITIASTGNQTDLEVADGGATLAGGGTVTLAGANAGINDASGTQTLIIADQTIQGQGNIGRNTTDFDNQGNLIHANVSGQVLTLDPANLFTNSGTLRASGGGILELQAGDFVNTSGTIEALAGSQVSLITGARIVGGELSTTGDGIIRSATSANVEFEDLALNGTYESGNNSNTRITGTITNTGSITIASTGNQTDLEVAVGGATLAGGGTVTLMGANAGINDASGTQTLIIADQTIQGRGNIGRNTTDFDNQGNLIHANVSGQVLVLDPANLFTNSGTLRASGGGILELQAGDFVNTGGTIEALAGSQVQLITGARIVGGELSTTGDGIIRSAISANVEFEDLALNGTYESGNNSDTRVTGTITNTGSITIASTGNQTDLEVADGGATLTGGGTVTLAGANAGINDASGTQTLIIADQTIQGQGNIGRNTTDFDNQGNLIHANVSGQVLTLDPANLFTNSGTLRASVGGILELQAGDFFNTGGTIEALAGSQVSLMTGARIVGGELSTTGDGIIRSATSANVEFEDLTLNGTYESGNNSNTRITGTITNTGSITIASTGNQTDLEVAVGGATLAGGGTVTLRGANAGIRNASGTQTLLIADQTVQGRGNIDVDLVNNGVLLGDSDSDVIRINSALAGDGRLGNVSIGRTHRPGDPGAGQPTASVPVEGSYEMRAGSSLFLEIGGLIAGDDFDQIVSDDATNTIVIGSSNTTLGVSLIDGFAPSIGDTFTLIDTAGTLEGEFSQLTFIGLPNLAFIWDVQYTEDRLLIELTGTFPLPGDFNADGKVDLLDLDILGANFGSTNASGGEGDANDDGNVDLLDLDILGANFGAMAPTSATAIPEPAAIWLILAALGMGHMRCPRQVR